MGRKLLYADNGDWRLSQTR